ncbi:MAG: GNAT family N-acetyltransferase [Lachnospiraceae bacterium]|nr:GNAT family N-acetyltransferase [Lachnospiraceae bacterium]
MDISKNDIRIRNAGAADCEQLAAWWNDGKIMAHAGFPNGLGTTTEHIREEIADDADDTKRRLIIEYKGTPIGEMSYYNLGGNVAEMGIKICNTDYQEKGLGRTILSMLITELFERGYEKIVLDTNLKNERAQHVYEMLGFRRLRVNIDSWEDQLGELQSSVDYELVPGDFQDYSA